jgi:hypothetical protein
VESDRSYDNRFRTHPRPEADADLTFAAIGDFGTGVRRPSSERRRQREVAEALHATVEREGVRFLLTTGDNIYAGRSLFGIPVGATGDEDDDWFFTFYQPYRYMINRVPVYPCIGNHDTAETEDRDDRGQLLDNLYLNERLPSEEAIAGASLDPGLFYRVRYGRDIELIAIDTSKEGFFRGKRLFEYPTHWKWIEQTLAAKGDATWRMAFCHHPPFCAGPNHRNTDRMDRLVPLLERGNVRAMFNGHEHNFQHSCHDGIDYFVTGAGSKLRKGSPVDFGRAHTVSWIDEAHFLLVTVTPATLEVRVIGELVDGELRDLPRFAPDGTRLTGPIVVQR